MNPLVDVILLVLGLAMVAFVIGKVHADRA